MIFVKKIVNKPVNSNTYVLSNFQSPYCLIIDPGSIDICEIITYINKIEKIPLAILLTHEHFDHIYGVNKLLDFNSDISIYASQKTLERIQDKRKNLSLYFDQIGYEILNSNFVVIKTEKIKIDMFNIRILKTIGHTDSSLSFLISGKLFTGDFLIKDEITITKLPSGNRNDFIKSFENFKNFIYNSLIFPGHGDVFKLDINKIESLL